jgi:hypothetical protein
MLTSGTPVVNPSGTFQATLILETTKQEIRRVI